LEFQRAQEKGEYPTVAEIEKQLREMTAEPVVAERM
jgi:hypothetical protein